MGWLEIVIIVAVVLAAGFALRSALRRRGCGGSCCGCGQDCSRRKKREP